jgi:hypothetical protein
MNGEAVMSCSQVEPERLPGQAEEGNEEAVMTKTPATAWANLSSSSLQRSASYRFV